MSLSPQLLDALQWPAMIVSVCAAWLVASNSKLKRNIGFWTFLASNVLWVAWGWHTSAWALLSLQLALAAMNVRGLFKTESAPQRDGDADAGYVPHESPSP